MASSPAVTPFIPPLSTPEGRSPPVIPASVSDTPAWRDQLQVPGGHPSYPMYPPTPYNTTPYIPNMSIHGTPAGPPGSYFPPPINLPPTGAAPPPSAGLSGDYTGYPQFTPATGWGHPMYQQPPAWGPPTGPPSGPMPGGWPGAYPPFVPPGMGGMPPGMGGMPPGMGGMPPGMGAMPPPGMGGPPPGWGAPPFATPGAPYGPGPSLWPPSQGGWGGGHAPAHHDSRLPVREQGFDIINKFAVGKHYGPVLDPFLHRVVRAELRINPLLLPAPEDNTDRAYLKWNMLFSSSHCLRSTDPPHKSWTTGRAEPATFPRVTQLRVISKTFPWMICIDAKDKSSGVTCAEVVDGIADYLQRLSRGNEYKSLSRERQKAIKDAYSHNRAPAHGVPGGVLGEGLRYLDWLGQETMYGGIERDDVLVRSLIGEVLPCTVVLHCIHRYPLTEREIQEQAAREAAQRERAASRERERRRSSSRASNRHHDADDEAGD